MSTLALTPRQPVPALSIPMVGGGRYVLGATPATTFDLVIFYRGLHCPICAKYLMELERLMPEFEKRGVQVIAVSSDNAERAQAMADKIKAEHLRVGTSSTYTPPDNGACTSALLEVRPRLVLTSQHYLVNRVCSLFAPTVRSTTVPHRPCPSPAHNFRTCWARLTLQWPRTTRHVANTLVQSKQK